MIFGLLYFCVVILCVNRLRSSFILYRIVKRHSRQSSVRRIWTCADNGEKMKYLFFYKPLHPCAVTVAIMNDVCILTCLVLHKKLANFNNPYKND